MDQIVQHPAALLLHGRNGLLRGSAVTVNDDACTGVNKASTLGEEAWTVRVPLQQPHDLALIINNNQLLLIFDSVHYSSP